MNKDIEQCYKSHTLVFTKEPNPNALQDHEKYLSNNPISRVEKYKILKAHQWQSGNLIWWRSDMDHAGSHFTNDIKIKECWSIHTYV